MTVDDLPRLAPCDRPPESGIRGAVTAVVLNSEEVVLGSIEEGSTAERALDCMNPAPQTIRPDMTPALAAALLKRNRYLLVTTERGKYIGRYAAARE